MPGINALRRKVNGYIIHLRLTLAQSYYPFIPRAPLGGFNHKASYIHRKSSGLIPPLDRERGGPYSNIILSVSARPF